MANKYRFDRDSITVNGRTFPARYEVMEHYAARNSFYSVVIMATVDGGEPVRIEVPASDKQHGAALAAAQMDAGTLADLAEPVQQQEQTTAAEPVKTESDPAQVQQGRRETISTDEKEEQTMKQDSKRIYNVYFTDHPTQAATIQAANKREAEKLARQYIRQWGLDAKIDRIECVPPLEKREGWTRPESRQDGAEPVSNIQPETAQDGAQAIPEAVSNIQQADAPTAAEPVQQTPTAAQDAPEEPTPETLEEIGGEAVKPDGAPNVGPVQAVQPTAEDDPKATRGPVPEKTFKNETISGKGWSIVFDAGCNRTRVIISDPVKAAARPIVEAAGFYYSRTLDSWNKKLTFRAYRAANALADKLRAALA